jgi:hypothetical protein
MSANSMKELSADIKPPTPLARRFARSVAGFGVGVVIGCAPFLGAVKLPPFSSILSLFPITLRSTLLPLGGFLIGFIAAGTQFYAGVYVPMARIKFWARRSLLTGLILLPAFLLCYLLLVRQVHYKEDFEVSFVTGLSRSNTCSCPQAITDSMCIRTLSANPDNIELCWGRAQVKLSEFILGISYLLFMGSFSFFISLLLLQENQKKRQAPPRQGRRTT